jgi:K+-sensing histidine kinase KdpD
MKNSRALEYLASLVVLGICSVIAVGLRNYLALENFAVIYLFGVMAVSVRCSRGPALTNAVLAVASFHYFCVPPFDSFRIEDPTYIVTLVGMLTVAVVMTTLTMRIRKQAAEALQREEQTRELYRLRDAAEMEIQKERTRNSLLSAVSHDLKTPLASIYGAATILLEEQGRLDATARRDLAQTIYAEAERLNRVLTNLLEMTRLDSGRKLTREWYPLEEIVGAALTRLDRSLRGRSVITDIPPGLPLVWGDEVLLEQVFINLLENAVKYTPAKTAIRIWARESNGRIEVAVEDRGSGFAHGDEAHVFEKFFRGKVEGIRGVGLGLAICKAIVDRHDGTITASNGPSGGAIVRFTLPLVEAPPKFDEMSEGTTS